MNKKRHDTTDIIKVLEADAEADHTAAAPAANISRHGAIGAITNSVSGGNALTKSKAELKKAKEAIADLETQLASREVHSEKIAIPMPGGGSAEATIGYISADLIDVSPENQRSQEFLNEISLADILPLIEQQGQTQPGLVRLKANGRYELVWGSRRLAAAKILSRDYFTYISDVDDAHVSLLSSIENVYKEVSAWEKGRFYEQKIQSGEFQFAEDLAKFYGVDPSQVSRARSTAEMDIRFVQCFPDPSCIPLTFSSDVSAIQKLIGEQVFERVDQLAFEKDQLWREGKTSKEITDRVIKELKQFAKKFEPKQSVPAKGRSNKYEGKDGSMVVVTTNKKGDTIYRLEGLTDVQAGKLQDFCKKTFGVEI